MQKLQEKVDCMRVLILTGLTLTMTKHLYYAKFSCLNPRNSQVIQMVKKFPIFMEPEWSSK